jgi:ABC-type sulfate transport system permease subunit
MDVSKAIDKAAKVERKVVGIRRHPTLKDTGKIEEQANAAHGDNHWRREWPVTAPATDQAHKWAGWGTALKPATEF